MLLCRVTHSLNFSVVPKADLLYEFVALTWSRWQKVMPDDHSEVVPLLPIPNRTVKRFSADDSADSRVKVGHCQAIKVKTPSHSTGRFFWPFFWFLASDLSRGHSPPRMASDSCPRFAQGKKSPRLLSIDGKRPANTP